MEAESRLELARKYIALSNKHRLSDVLALFDDYATYRSDQLGNFSGKERIAAMMSQFFDRYPDVRWVASGFQAGPAETIEFDFVMHATHPETGEPVERRGVERIAVTAAGKIRQITVTSRDL
jgi:hypothetical protein